MPTARKAHSLEQLYLDVDRKKEEQRAAIKASMFSAMRIRDKLQLIKECSQLCKAQEYELEMAIELIARGQKILGETP